MILAAGRGERMKPLTDITPKPLLIVNNKCLIEYHIEALVKAGISQIVINHAWLGEQIPKKLGDGSKYGCSIQYSPEPVGAFETAGGIIKALPLLGDEPFIVVNGDVWTNFDFAKLKQQKLTHLAHIVLVNNPEHNLDGDFGVQGSHAELVSKQKYTFSGIGLYSSKFFQEEFELPLGLGKLLKQEIDKKQVTAEIYQGQWSDIGTPERLRKIQEQQA